MGAWVLAEHPPAAPLFLALSGIALWLVPRRPGADPARREPRIIGALACAGRARSLSIRGRVVVA